MKCLSGKTALWWPCATGAATKPGGGLGTMQKFHFFPGCPLRLQNAYRSAITDSNAVVNLLLYLSATKSKSCSENL